MSSILNKLRMLGVQTTPKTEPIPQPANENADRLPGRDIVLPSGTTRLVETRHPFPLNIGSIRVSHLNFDPLIGRYCKLREEQPDPSRLLFLDTETTGLMGGTGTWVFLAGIGRIENDHFVVRQYLMPDPTGEPAFLEALAKELSDDTVIVSFNGKSFDCPLLETRFLMNGMRTTLRGRPHIDLVHPSRRLWRDVLETCALSYIEYKLFGLIRSEEDIPGHMIPQLYFDWLKTGDASFFPGVLYHNACDITAMTALLRYMSGCVSSDNDTLHLVDPYGLGRFLADTGNPEGALLSYAKALTTEPENRERVLHHFSMVGKRLERWELLVEQWEREVSHGMVTAMIELSKYHEHRTRDYRQAKDWAVKAADNVLETSGTKGLAILAELRERILRLNRKLGFKE